MERRQSLHSTSLNKMGFFLFIFLIFFFEEKKNLLFERSSQIIKSVENAVGLCLRGKKTTIKKNVPTSHIEFDKNQREHYTHFEYRVSNRIKLFNFDLK